MLDATLKMKRGLQKPWQEAPGSWSTFAEACKAAKTWADLSEGGAQGRWKSTSMSKKGKWRVLQCNNHVGCPFLQKITQCASTGLWVRRTCFDHSTVLNDRVRSNSALTFKQEEQLLTALEDGLKPAALLSAMTKDEMRDLRRRGENPLQHKRPEGGLEGQTANSIS